MTFIAVDVGNSCIKAGVVPPAGGPWSTVQRWSQSADFKVADDNPITWWIASVNRPRCEQLTAWIESHRPQDRVQVLTWRQVPLNLQVASPQQVGLDRLCAAVAARKLVENRPCIVVDAGTAITVDGVSGDGEFLGGCIFLGIRGSLDHLAQSTDALPRLELANVPDDLDPFGKSTALAMQAGALFAAVGGISEIVGRMQHAFDENAEVILTGGTAPLLRSFLPMAVTWIEHLVLDGVVLVGSDAGERP